MISQLIISSVLLGGILASLSIGFSMLWKVMGVVNVAQPTFALLSAYIIYTLMEIGVDPIISLFLILPIFFAVGASMYIFLLKRFSEREITGGSTVLTFGLMLLIEGLLHGRWGATEKSFSGVNYLTGSVTWQGLVFPRNYCIGFAISLAALILIYLLLHRTFLGKAIRAVWQDREGALLCGINFDRISWITCGLSITLGALGGLCLTFVYTFFPTVHVHWLFPMFLITVLGGLGSMKGAIVGGILVSLVENFTSVYIGHMWATVAVFILLLLVLMVKPTGLFRT